MISTMKGNPHVTHYTPRRDERLHIHADGTVRMASYTIVGHIERADLMPRDPTRPVRFTRCHNFGAPLPRWDDGPILLPGPIYLPPCDGCGTGDCNTGEWTFNPAFIEALRAALKREDIP